MKNLFLLSALLMFLSNTLFAQKVIEKHWGAKNYDGAFAVTATSDGGYIMSGLTKSQGDTNGDIIVIKTATNGDTLWTYRYGGPHLEGGNGVIETNDGGYMVTGHTESFGNGDCDAFLMKLNKQGEQKWFKTYGALQDDVAAEVIELAEGGYVMVGFTQSFGVNKKHIYIIKTDANGDSIWTRHYGGKETDYGYSIVRVPGGGYLTVGCTNSYGAGAGDGWLLRLKENGDTMWTKTFGGKGDERFYKILATPDGGYMVAGYTSSLGAGKSDGWLVKLDANAKKVWEKTYGTKKDDGFFNMTMLSNGNFLAAGYSTSMDSTGNAYAASIDSRGNLQNTFNFGGKGSYARCIAGQGLNTFMAAGTAFYPGDPTGDLYYMEMDYNSAGIQSFSPSPNALFTYPDPVSNVFNLILPVSQTHAGTRLEIIDINGRIIKSTQNSPAKEISIPLEGNSSGIYFYRLICKDQSEYTGKFMIK